MKRTVRVPMPPSVRAKQFAPYQALHGLNEAIRATERIETPRKILAPDRIEELNDILKSLKKGQHVSVIYYEEGESSYVLLSGNVVKVEPYFEWLQVGNRAIDFSEIDDIILS